ncbi:MAG: PQQ-binding-like beta-propeller repeat protein [Thermoplasmatota archaeon]
MSSISKITAAAILVLLLFISFTGSDPSEGAWSQWRGDPLHLALEDGDAPEKGELIWSFDTGSQVLSSPTFYPGGLVIGSEDDWVYCLDPVTGSMNWKFKSGDDVQATVLLENGRGYFGSLDRNFYCISLPPEGSTSEPETLWSFETEGEIKSSAHAFGDSVIFSDLAGIVYRLSKEGQEIWRSPISDLPIWASGIVDEERGVLFIGDTGRSLYRLSLDDGEVLDKVEFGEYAEVYSSGVLHDDNLLLTAGMDQRIYNVDPDTMDIKWSFFTGHDTYSTPIVRDDRVFFGSFEYTWCLPIDDPDSDGNISEDEVIWSSPTHDFQGGSSPVVSDGKLFIGSDDYNLYCFNETNGDLVWTFSTGGYVYSSPVIYLERVYFGSSDRSVYCVGVRPPGLSAAINTTDKEITSDNSTSMIVRVTDNEGSPVEGAEVTFSISAGYIAFDKDGNTRLKYLTNEEGEVEVFYFPIRVSSRSTVNIELEVVKEGLEPGTASANVIVEPGEEADDETASSTVDKSGRLSNGIIIAVIAGLNLLTGFVTLVVYLRNRNEEREVLT